MKLKTWLLSSYLLVMALPLLLAYLLFAWINDYNEDQKVKEFFTTTVEMKDIQRVLDDPALYQTGSTFDEVARLANDKLSIQLFNHNGLVLYSSSPVQTVAVPVNRESLYEDLFSLQQNFRSHRYKAPVFDKGKLAGFYQIELAREGWVEAVSKRTKWTMILFSVLFILLYASVALFVNRKVNRRLTNLQNEMTAFARGHQPSHEKVTAQDEIGQLQQHFYDMQKKIVEARRLIEKDQQEREYMIAAISHDLKTPLTSIRAYAESLELNEKLTDEEKGEYRQIIIEKSNFMKQMLDDLLMFTLLQSPSYEMERTAVDGSEFFDMLVSDYEPLCRHKQIQLCSSANVTGEYAVNPKQLVRVVDNLMTNAIHHTETGGKIWIAALSEQSADWLFEFVAAVYTFDFRENVYVIVQNEGKGIAEEQIEFIFNPLYQADRSRNKKPAHGTGLGLSIAKQMMEKHNGDVQLFSKELVGTCVICRLPKVL
ncbi:cell wall metabolism sensor histidine kinase WalK [Sporosarcina sp. P33]|uniref:sensor histidine kinase n=1 Tax=Sporosarcina sp. P33 TaxID=1930764 RepID=UPI0009C13B6B|nr:HAMP domain-containing sensor histidine kinase [Sporosarcina sp. P33]ARD47273.1 two-component sensor histidine kinase [Sporosarcina sp. P33]